jgi:hypothetical protein|tara:strand:- start:14741 stop:14890 length:150 start_codon:yes stop_codon:yes gene_type:complete
MIDKYKEIASEIGGPAQEKNNSYGDSFGEPCRILGPTNDEDEDGASVKD